MDARLDSIVIAHNAIMSRHTPAQRMVTDSTQVETIETVDTRVLVIVEKKQKNIKHVILILESYVTGHRVY